MSGAPDEYLSVAEAARMLGFPPRTILRWVDEGRLPHRRTSAGEVQLPRQAVRDLLVDPLDADEDG